MIVPALCRPIMPLNIPHLTISKYIKYGPSEGWMDGWMDGCKFYFPT